MAPADGMIIIKKSETGGYHISGNIISAGLPVINHLVDARAWLDYKFDGPLDEVSVDKLKSLFPNEDFSDATIVAMADCDGNARNDINSGNPYRIDKVVIVKNSKGELVISGISSPDCRSHILQREFGRYAGFVCKLN